MNEPSGQNTALAAEGKRGFSFRDLPALLCSQNIYESFVCIAILTFIGGFLNAYTYELHGEYLSTMNTGNMARIGLAFTHGNMSQTGPYFMSIAANALGAMTTFICREKLAASHKQTWQRMCLMAEMVIFLVIGLLPAATPHLMINFMISFLAGFQLASFTLWEGNLVATTIASGNIRFVGEHLGNAILYPSWKNFLKFFLFFLITISFPVGVITGSLLVTSVGKYGIFLVSLLILAMLLLEGDIQRRSKKA